MKSFFFNAIRLDKFLIKRYQQTLILQGVVLIHCIQRLINLWKQNRNKLYAFEENNNAVFVDKKRWKLSFTTFFQIRRSFMTERPILIPKTLKLNKRFFSGNFLKALEFLLKFSQNAFFSCLNA